MRPLGIVFLIVLGVINCSLILIALIEGGVIPDLKFVDQGSQTEMEVTVTDR
jgi:hypothetical protein